MVNYCEPMAESWENPRPEQKTGEDTYARAGVNVNAGNEAVARYAQVLGPWRHADQLEAIGGFAGLFRVPGDRSRALVASTTFSSAMHRRSSFWITSQLESSTLRWLPRS